MSWQVVDIGGVRLGGHETCKPVAGFTVQPKLTVPWKLLREVRVRVVDPWLPVKLTGVVAEIPKSTMWKLIGAVVWDKDPPRKETVPVTVRE